MVAEREPKDPALRQAIDDAYTTLVDEVDRHTARSLQRRFLNLVSNRRPKYRRRQAIESLLARSLSTEDTAAEPVELLARREIGEMVLAAVRPDERALLWGVAEGRSYEELARAVNEPVGTLKARVSRLRGRLRSSLAELEAAA